MSGNQSERDKVLDILEKQHTAEIDRAIIDQRHGALGSTLRINIHKQSKEWIEELRQAGEP